MSNEEAFLTYVINVSLIEFEGLVHTVCDLQYLGVLCPLGPLMVEFSINLGWKMDGIIYREFLQKVDMTIKICRHKMAELCIIGK